MKKEFLARKGALIYGCLFLLLIMVFVLIMMLIDNSFNKGLLLVVIIPILCIAGIPLCWGCSSILFAENVLIYKESLFSKKKIVEYEHLSKIYIDFGGFAITRYIGANPRIYLFFYNRKVSDFQPDIQYEIIQQLLEKKSKHCKIKIHFNSLRRFSKRYRELLKDYLTIKQKDEIARLLAKKEAKRKKKD